MGRHAAARKRGSAPLFGIVAAPDIAGFSVGTITATTIPVNRAASFPAGVDRWGLFVVNVLTGAVAFENITNLTSLTATGLTTLTQYRVYVYWSANLARISSLSLLATVTTT